MELEVISRKENPLLGRIEIEFKISHSKEKTPTRNDVQTELATIVNTKKDRVIIDKMETIFGKSETIGYAKVYDSQELAKKIESDYILGRNKMTDKKAEKKSKKTKKPKK
jgi:small subunit ribosomal protein S24e